MDNSDRGELTLMQQEFSRALEKIEQLARNEATRSRLFPGGITKIAVTAKSGATELSLNLEGPNPQGGGIESIETLATKRVSISFAANAEGTLSYDGKTFPCLGKSSLKYAKDLTVKGVLNEDKFRKKYSNEFSVWMEFAILIMGDRGIYIHEGFDTLATNDGESAGCIHLAPGNAESFWNWVAGPTRITIDYPW